MKSVYSPVIFCALLCSVLLLNACCSEMDTYYMWTIENKTADTIKIAFTNQVDSIVVWPHNQYGKIINTDFTCASGFEENTFSVTVSGNKKLVKKLYLSDNWETSTHVRQLYCDQRKECTFVIHPKDIE